MSRTPSDSETRWCPTCGSIVPPDRDACPHCGMPMPRIPRVPDPMERSEEEDIEERPTRFLPRLGSAIPDPGAPEDEAPRRDRSTFAMIVAAICSLIVIGGAFLIIGHPWDPDLYDTRAQEPADTSMDGFPGTIDRLQGQDIDVAQSQAEHLSSEQVTYRELVAALDSMDEYADELDEEFEDLERDFAGTDDVRQTDAANAHQTSVAISNLIADLQDLDMSSGVYLESQRKLIQLGNYLRNRADALTGAWEVSLASADPTSEKLRTLDEAQIENERYRGLYRDAERGLEIPEPDG